MTPSQIRPVHHLGYWVDDLDEGIDRAVRALGVGPFLVDEHVRFDEFTLADGTRIEDPAYLDHTAAFAAWGPMVIELAVVHTVDPWLAHAYGLGKGGLGHVSWVADDLAVESARLEAQGCRLLHTASSGAVAVAWHDGGALFPHPIEVHRAGAPILGMHGRLAALAADWDGRDRRRPIRG